MTEQSVASDARNVAVATVVPPPGYLAMVKAAQWTEYARFRELFITAMDPDMHSIEVLDEQIKEDSVQFFSSSNAAIVTHVENYLKARIIIGLWAVGNLDEIVGDLIPEAEEWGRSVGCTRAMIESRGGWLRALRNSGYGKFSTTVVKELR